MRIMLNFLLSEECWENVRRTGKEGRSLGLIYSRQCALLNWNFRFDIHVLSGRYQSLGEELVCIQNELLLFGKVLISPQMIVCCNHSKEKINTVNQWTLGTLEGCASPGPICTSPAAGEGQCSKSLLFMDQFSRIFRAWFLFIFLLPALQPLLFSLHHRQQKVVKSS